MADNFQGLVDVLPNIGSVYGEALSVHGITGPNSLLGLVFPNAEQLLNTPWWAKFIEHYLFKSPITTSLEHLNLNLFHEKFWSQPIPSLINLGRGQAKGR